MRILALGGAGDMGRMAVAALLAAPQVTSVTIADKNYEIAQRLVELTGSDKLSAVEIDITDEAKLENLKNKACDKNLSLETLKIDINDERSVDRLFKNISESFGFLDILVNNAGFGLVGPLENLSIEEIKSQFETNFFSAVRLIQLSIPLMRQRGKGKIIKSHKQRRKCIE